MDSIRLFLESCRSQETRNSYQLSFQKYIEFVGNDLFFGNNPRMIESKIIEFILSLKNKGKSYGAILNYLNAIKSFYKINDIVLNVHKINKFMPEQMRVNKDRAYTHEEICKLLEISDERMRVVVLLLSSTGCRLGAIPSMKLGNIDKNKVLFYENTREEYFSFITSECQKAINAYTDIRSRYGEKLDDNSHLLREQFDYRDSFAIKNPRKVTDKLLRWKLMMMAEKCGIRKRGNDKTKRQGIMIAHGFRKLFTTQLVNSKVNAEIREMLLGHKIGLASCYYRPSVEEMYEEYEKAIDNLTIDPSKRLQRKVETLTIEKSRLDILEAKFKQIEQQIKIKS